MIKRLLVLLVFALFVIASNGQSIAKWKIEDVVRSYSANNDTVYVVNFWATFCKPCIEEIPDFIRIVNKYKDQKVKLLLVSLDLPSYYPAKIAAFAKKNNYNTNIVWLNETDADHFCPAIDKKWSGAIPSTIIVNNKTGYKKFVEDQMKAEEFEESLKDAIGGNTLRKYMAPMNDAEIIDYSAFQRSCYGPNFDIATFKSCDDRVFSIEDGRVSNVVVIEDMEVIIISGKDSFWYAYSNIGSSNVKKGDVVKKDQVIGHAQFDLNKDRPTLDLYLSNYQESVPLVKTNFIPRKDSKLIDHSFDPSNTLQ